MGKVQLEVICSLLEEKYHVGVAMKEPSVIYLERPQKKASCTIHIEVPPNPFWASIGLTVTPLPVGSGTQYKSEVSLGYLNQSFQNAVMEGVRYGMEQGLYGWGVTDCQICFDYGVYYSPVSTPADFRFLAPVVLEQALKKQEHNCWNHTFPLPFLHRRNIFHGLIMTHQSIAQSLNQPDLKKMKLFLRGKSLPVVLVNIEMI